MTLYENHKSVLNSSPLTESIGDDDISRKLSTHISPATIKNSSERESQAKKLTMGSLAAFNNARKEGIFPPAPAPTLPKEIGRSCSTLEARLSLSPPVNYSTNISTGLPVSSSGTISNPVPGKPMICRPIFPNIPFSPFTSPCSSPFAKRREFRESQRVSIEKDGDLLQLNQYKLKEPIGQGSFGIVKLAYNEEDEKHYAMKILSKKKLIQKSGVFGRAVPSRRLGKFSIANPLAKIYTEVAILKKLNHPNVVKLVEVLDDPAEDNLYLVFELLERGEILQVPTTNPLTEEKAWKYFRDVILGIEYLHYQKIIHRDIKPSNLLVSDDDRIKISDFGVCNEFTGEDDHLRSTSGTPAFTAPEALKAMSGSYGGKAADVWQLGVTLFAMVYGVVPFHDSSIITLYYKIQHESLKFPTKPAISNELQDLLIRMLQKDPSSRIMISEIKIHDWITQQGEHPLPSEEENCKSYIQVTDEEIINSVRSIPKLDTLIMVKTMLKNHSFHHPFKRHGCKMKNLLHLNGRSHSAPSSYDFYFERKMSLDRILPPVNEAPRDPECTVRTPKDDSTRTSDQELIP